METETMRGVRFQSEQFRVMAEGVDKDYMVRQTRIMPGVPIAVEKVRSIVFESNGVHGIRNFQRIFLALDDEVRVDTLTYYTGDIEMSVFTNCATC